MELFYRLQVGLKDRGQLYPIAMPVAVHDDSDYYTSLFYYTEIQKQEFERRGTIAGMTDVVTNRLFFDFDSKENLEAARADAAILVRRLHEKGIQDKDMQVCFSGMKGFSVELRSNQLYTPGEFGAIVDSLAGDLSTFDRVVRNPSRIVRVPGTRHSKSGLYKTILTPSKLATTPLERILAVAAKPRTVVDLTEIDLSILVPPRDKDVPLISEQLPTRAFDVRKCPKWLSPARYFIQEGMLPRGNGHSNTAFMILAATYKAQGFDAGAALMLLKDAARKQAEQFNCETFPTYELQNNIVNIVYGDNWNGGTYAEDNAVLEYIYDTYNLPRPGKVAEVGARPIEHLFGPFKEFATNIENNTIKLGIPEIDSCEDIQITSQMLVGLLGAPSSGKTTIMTDILNSTSKRGIKTLVFQMDMGSNLMFQRLIQKHTGMSRKAIYAAYTEHDEQQIAIFEKSLSKNYSNASFCFSTAYTVEDIRRVSEQHKEQVGELKLVIIDYLECIQGPYSDSVANMSLIIQKLKDMANDLGITVLVLLQPPKSAGDPSNALHTYTQIKGTATISQAASIVFTVWRPGFSVENPQNDRYLSIAVVKNRSGGLRAFDFAWEGLRGTIRPLLKDEQIELNKLRIEQKLKREDVI